MGVPLVKGGQNLPPMVGIELTGLPNIGGGPVAPLVPPVPALLIKCYYLGRKCKLRVVYPIEQSSNLQCAPLDNRKSAVF